MNYFIQMALVCMMSSACASTSPGDIAISINNRLKNVVDPLHTQLVTALKMRKKEANRQRQLECKQAQQNLQAECDAQKKALIKDCTADKQERTGFYKQIIDGLSNTKKKARGKNRQLGTLFEAGSGYLNLLHDQAKTAQIKPLAKDLKKEVDWLDKLRQTTVRSKVALDEPLKTTKTMKP